MQVSANPELPIIFLTAIMNYGGDAEARIFWGHCKATMT
jgi:hypothetical protein